MGSYETNAKFCRSVGISLNSRVSEDAYKMLCKEADFELTRLKSDYPGKHNLYSKALENACDRMIYWWKMADEWLVDDLSVFISSHRISCVWCIITSMCYQIDIGEKESQC